MKTTKIKNVLFVLAIALGIVSVFAFSNDSQTTEPDQALAYTADLYSTQPASAAFNMDLGKCGDDKKAEKSEKCGEGKCGDDKKASKCGDDKKAEKCGEGKCGDDKKASKCGDDKKAEKCGEGKCGDDKKADKAKKETKEMKCGEGKCGK